MLCFASGKQREALQACCYLRLLGISPGAVDACIVQAAGGVPPSRIPDLVDVVRSSNTLVFPHGLAVVLHHTLS